MTIRISPQKITKIMKSYFGGYSQVEIAKRMGVDQSTISLYSSRFKQRAGEIGIVSTGKEYNMFDEIEALRSLSTELLKAGLTVEEAKQGTKIFRDFLRLGVNPDRHMDLIKVCKKIDNPHFVEAAMTLDRIESEHGITYEEALKKVSSVIEELKKNRTMLSKVKTELGTLTSELQRKQAKVKELDNRISQVSQELERKRSETELEIKQMLQNKKVKEEEITQVAQLKATIQQQGLDLETLLKLAKEFRQ